MRATCTRTLLFWTVWRCMFSKDKPCGWVGSMSEKRIVVVLVEDHPMLREGTAALPATQPNLAVIG